MPNLLLSDVLPNTQNSLHGSGFLFGAGTSVEAGYPMMSGLTRQVVSQLTSIERELMDQALAAEGELYDDTTAIPNIERIADLIISYAINSGLACFSVLEVRVRDLVTRCIIDVRNPNITHHVRFFKYLKQRAYGRHCCVYIFTTNYDVLFELAATEAGVAIETGFTGSVNRFFDPERFGTSCGRVTGMKFNAHPVLTVKLLKIHGSISWTTANSQICERHPDALPMSVPRVMVLPRRKKTFESPSKIMFSVGRAFVASAGLTPSGGMPARFG